MDTCESKIFQHYFKKYKKKNNMFNGFQFIADKNINYNDLHKNKILTQIAGTRRKEKRTFNFRKYFCIWHHCKTRPNQESNYDDKGVC